MRNTWKDDNRQEALGLIQERVLIDDVWRSVGVMEYYMDCEKCKCCRLDRSNEPEGMVMIFRGP
jgi:hypothetical protein